MRRIVFAAVVALVSGCSTRPPVNKSAYLRVQPESLTDLQGRKGYDGRRIEVDTLVGADGYGRRANGLFRLENGALEPQNVKPIAGYYLMRVSGTFYDGGSDGPVLALDVAEKIEVPFRVVTLAEIDADPKSFDVSHVTLEGAYVDSPDAATLDQKIWVVSPSPGKGKDRRVIPSGRIRVTGWLFTRGGHFGPQRKGRYALDAEEWTQIP
jgi:hypothetical protein